MKKVYFTRKNLIELGFVFLFFILFLFCYVCVDGAHTFMAKENPVELIYLGFNFPSVELGTMGYLVGFLFTIYGIVFDAGLILIRRLVKFRKERFWSYKWILIVLGWLVLCLLLSLGLGLLLASIIDKENVGLIMMAFGGSLLISVIIYLILALIIFAVFLLIVNFKNIDKPYRFFNIDEQVQYEANIDAEEEKEIDEQNHIEAEFGDIQASTSNANNAIIAGGSASASMGQTTFELGDREKVFPSLSTIDKEFSGFEENNLPEVNINLEKLCNDFRNYLCKKENLYFDIETIRSFISAFATSRIIILEGLSGTGKSSLPRYFAKFISSESNFLAVQTTFRDKTSLIGYFNDFSQTYNETDFLKSLYRANYLKDHINIMVLDEFNIARVEYYFADFLSLLEYPKQDWKIRVMNLPYEFDAPSMLHDGILKIEENTYFVCTANKDDSTYSISDKVYDRAIILDFDDKNEPFQVKEDVEPIHLGYHQLQQLFNEALKDKNNSLTKEDLSTFNEVTKFILDNFDVAFGNRIMNQINNFVPVYVKCGGTKLEALDFMLSRKILYKLEGRYEDYIKDSLISLKKLIEKLYPNKDFKMSKHMIDQMIKRL